MTRNNSNRGFASMDRDERRQISSMGGRARGSQNSREDYDEEDYGNDYDEDDDYETSASYDEDYDDRDSDYGDYGRDSNRGQGSGRGFAGMDRDEVRRIASKGGHASHGGRSPQYGRGSSSRGYSDYEEDYGGGRSYERSGRDSDYDDYDSDGGRTSNRGFASMPREEVRRIASMGGRAAHESGNAHEWDSREAREAGHRGGQSRGEGGYSSRGNYGYEDEDYGSRGRGRSDYEDEDYGGRSSNRGGGRGFASMDRNEVRRIAAKGGHASRGGHDGGRGGSHSGNGSSGRGSSSDNRGGRSSSSSGGSTNGRSSGSRNNGGNSSGSRNSGGNSSGSRGSGNSSSGSSGSGRRGFAAMSKSERTRISSMGGRASHGGSRNGR